MADENAAQQAAGGDGQQQQQNGQNDQAGGQQQAADWKAGIPAHMLKETPEATLGEVYKAFDGFQKKASAAGPVGKSPDDYKFEFDDKLKPYFASTDDPALRNFQAVAHKHGLPVKVANAIIAETFGPLAAEGKLPMPFNPRAELDGIAKMLGGALLCTLAISGGPVYDPSGKLVARFSSIWRQKSMRGCWVFQSCTPGRNSSHVTGA